MNVFDDACLKYEQGELAAAFDLFLADAKNGGSESMSRIAVMYGCGEGVNYDFDKSIFWDQEAIKAGNDISLKNLAITYRTTGDLVKAKYWFEKALAKGDGEAAYELARIYMISDKETETVIQLLSKALEINNLCEDSREKAEELLKLILLKNQKLLHGC